MTDTNTILLAVALAEGALATGALWFWQHAETWRKYWRTEYMVERAGLNEARRIIRDVEITAVKKLAAYKTQEALDARRADRAANQARARKGAATKRARVMDDPIMVAAHDKA